MLIPLAFISPSSMEIIPLLADICELRQAQIPGPAYLLILLIFFIAFVSWLTIYFYKWHLIKQRYLARQKRLLRQSLYFYQKDLLAASFWNCILYLLAAAQYKEELQNHTKRCLFRLLSWLPLCGILFSLLFEYV